jgi:predicted amidohydrolase
MNPQRYGVEANLKAMQVWLNKAASDGSTLVVFPEFALTGQGYASAAEVRAVAEDFPGESVNALASRARELGIYAVFGMHEREARFPCVLRGWQPSWCPANLYSTMVLVGPDGVVGRYRTSHLSADGDVRFLRAGDSLSPVFPTQLGPIGLAAGADVYQPEVIRSLSLRGALIIAAGQSQADGVWAELARTRASENHVYVVAANRVGSEAGTTYHGGSVVAGNRRKILAQANNVEEQVIYATLNIHDMGEPSGPHIDRATGKLKVTHYQLDRSPRLYGGIVAP